LFQKGLGNLDSFFSNAFTALIISVLLLCFSQRLTQKKMSFFIFSAYFAFLLFDFSWLATTTYHGSYVLYVWVILSFLFSIPVYFWAYFYYQSKKSVINCVIFSLGIPIIEWLRLYFLSGYPFSAVGMFFDQLPFINRFISNLGLYGLSWLFTYTVLSIDLIREKKFKVQSLYLFFPIIPFFLYEGQITDRGHLKVQIIQPGLMVNEKTLLHPYMDRFVPVKRQLQIILRKIKWGSRENPDFILLPEGLFPGLLDEPFIYSIDLVNLLKDIFPEKEEVSFQESVFNQKEAIQHVVKTLKVPLIYGATRMDEKGDCYNSLILQDINSPCQIYDKRILVPMGEYLPFDFLTNIALRYGVFGFFSIGKEKSLDLNHLKIIPSICYEDCFPLLGLSKVEEDGAFMLNITNDGWFYPSRLPEVHARLSRLRAMEFGKVMIRSCEQSMSGWIDQKGNGRFFDNSYENIPVQKIAVISQATLYSKIGNSWLIFASFLVIFIKIMVNWNAHWIRLALKRPVN
jgi:apolipoprotein N-acyltransferase